MFLIGYSGFPDDWLVTGLSIYNEALDSGDLLLFL
jgi:hypothetical protein